MSSFNVLGLQMDSGVFSVDSMCYHAQFDHVYQLQGLSEKLLLVPSCMDTCKPPTVHTEK